MALIPVYMPKYGMTMTEGLIVEWHCDEGQPIGVGAPLFTVETEKANSEVGAPEAGVLAEICVAAGEEAPVGSVVAYIETEAGT